jgi:hypothetical protein
MHAISSVVSQNSTQKREHAICCNLNLYSAATVNPAYTASLRDAGISTVDASHTPFASVIQYKRKENCFNTSFFFFAQGNEANGEMKIYPRL